MGTNGNRNENHRTDIGLSLQESAAVWEQLLRLAEGGDIRAIKLYYDMLEKKQRPVTAGGHAPDMEPMAAIRQAVFGDAAFGGGASFDGTPDAPTDAEDEW